MLNRKHNCLDNINLLMYFRAMDKAEAIRAVAEIVAGLQVPVSLGMQLGAAREPWDRLYQEVNTFGWTDADALEKSFQKLFA